MNQTNIFRVDVNQKTLYVAAPTLADLQRIAFGTAAHVAVVIREFKEKADFSLPEDVDNLRLTLIN